MIVVAHISLFIALYIAVCLFLYHALCYLVLWPQDWINTTTTDVARVQQGDHTLFLATHTRTIPAFTPQPQDVTSFGRPVFMSYRIEVSRETAPRLLPVTLETRYSLVLDAFEPTMCQYITCDRKLTNSTRHHNTSWYMNKTKTKQLVSTQKLRRKSVKWVRQSVAAVASLGGGGPPLVTLVKEEWQH